MQILTRYRILLTFLLIWAGHVTAKPLPLKGKSVVLPPWSMVIEKFSKNHLFFRGRGRGNSRTKSDSLAPGQDSIRHFASQPTQSLSVSLVDQPVSSYTEKRIQASLSKWGKASWSRAEKVEVTLRRGQVILPLGISREGFFRLKVTMDAQNAKEQSIEAYALILANWKSSVFAFCRQNKNQIEMNRDPQLIRSSIAASHWDHTMEMISETNILSEEIMVALSEARKGSQAFEAGEYPDFVVGHNNLQLCRFKGAPIAEFMIRIPKEYSASEHRPVYIITDEDVKLESYSGMEEVVSVYWKTAIIEKEIDWKSYKHVTGILQQKLNIDIDRVYLSGFCKNGGAASLLAYIYPDQWADCWIMLGNTRQYLARNALNLSLFYGMVHHDSKAYTAFYDFNVKCFQYFGCKRFNFSEDKDIGYFHDNPDPVLTRAKYPERVLYSVESLHNPKAYWASIDGRSDENLLGTIDAKIKDQTIEITTQNVDAYGLDLIQAPIDSNQPMKVIENGVELGSITKTSFNRKARKYSNATHTKHKFLSGPVSDVFDSPYLVVYGTQGNNKPFKLNSKSVAEKLAKRAPCLADSDVLTEDIDNHNLVLVGSATTNDYIAGIASKLPVLTDKTGIITTNSMFFKGDVGYILIHPNPKKPQNYVAIFEAASTRAMEKMHSAYLEMQNSRPADIGIYEITKQGGIRWRVLEKLNTIWTWHPHFDKTVAVLEQDHPNWQWKQWVAHVVRRQMKSDVAICDDYAHELNTLSAGDITYRDMFNAFENAWFIKVNMSGKSLKQILTTPMSDVSKRHVDMLVIDGASVFTEPASNNENSLNLGNIVSDKLYTVALPHKCIRGDRMGVIVKDYEIIDQDFFIPMLDEYLTEVSSKNIDLDLSSFKLSMH